MQVQGTAAEREALAEPGRYGGDPHLRAANQIRGYHVLAQDGDIGHVEDFLFDDQTAQINGWMVVDTKNWFRDDSFSSHRSGFPA